MGSCSGCAQRANCSAVGCIAAGFDVTGGISCADVTTGMGSLGVGSLAFATTEPLGAACSVEFDAVSRIGELFDDTTTGGAVVEGEVGVERLGPQPNANEKKTSVAIRVFRLGMDIIFPNRKEGMSNVQC